MRYSLHGQRGAMPQPITLVAAAAWRALALMGFVACRLFKRSRLFTAEKMRSLPEMPTTRFTRLGDALIVERAFSSIAISCLPVALSLLAVILRPPLYLMIIIRLHGHAGSRGRP